MKKISLHLPARYLRFTLIFPAFTLFFQENACAQTPLLRQGRETAIFASTLGWTTINYAIQFSSPKIPAAGKTWQLRGLDGYHYQSYNKKLKYLSDLTLLGTGILAGAAYFAASGHSEAFKKSVVTGESIWMAACFTHSVKMAARRNRPYTQASGFTYSKRDDVYSFFSGHSSMASALVTSALLMRNRNEKSFSGQNICIGLAAAAGATTAWLRIRAGKHYPSDVLTGIITGMGIAWLNYRIHEN